MDNHTILTVTPKIEELSSLCLENSKINPELYTKYNVQRGLRDLQGRGVLAGLTNISNIISSVEKNGKTVPCDGVLLYRGIDIRDIVKGFMIQHPHGELYSLLGRDAAFDHKLHGAHKAAAAQTRKETARQKEA